MSRNRSTRSLAPGFTLVELLVALAIFALMSGFAYRGLHAMLEAREALQKESRKWRDVALAVGRLERDLGAVLPLRALGASGTPLAPLSSAIEANSGAPGLSLTRAGNPLLENALSSPQRVAWRLRDNTLERLAWSGADAAPREEPIAVPVLAPVSALAFRFLDPKSLEWRSTWALPGSADDTLP